MLDGISAVPWKPGQQATVRNRSTGDDHRYLWPMAEVVESATLNEIGLTVRHAARIGRQTAHTDQPASSGNLS